MLGRHGVDQKIESPHKRLKLLWLRAEHEGVGPELSSVAFFPRRSAEDRHAGPKSPGQLHRHVAQAAEPHHADGMPLAYLVSLQRRIGGDPGAQQRRHAGQRHPLLDPKGNLFLDDDMSGVATLCGRRAVEFGAVVGVRDVLLTELLLARLARLALSAGIDEAADAGEVARLEPADFFSGGDNRADDLVARHTRVGSGSPFAPRGVDIGMADAAVGNLDHDVIRPGIAALELKWLQRFFGGHGSVGL